MTLKVKEPGQSGNAEPSTPTPEPPEGATLPPAEGPPKADPSKLKVEDVYGSAVPEKFKGKTLKEFLELSQQTETALGTAKRENAEWLKHFQEKEREAAQKPPEKGSNPAEVLGEDQAQAVGLMVGQAVKPIYDAIAGLTLEYTKTTRPDFDEHFTRVKEVYESLPPAYKFHPAYGWDFAYRFAKAEAMGTAPPPGPLPPAGGPSGGGAPGEPEKPTLSKDQLYIAKRMGMTPEEYIKYQEVVDVTATGGK